jgi:expansin (peptidoglycan-binding protein)
LLRKLRVQKAGPTNVYVYTMAAATTPGNNATSSPFNASYDLLASGAASTTASVYVGGSFGLVSAPFGARSTVSNPVTMDTTAQQTVQATLTCTSGTAGNTLSLMGLKVWALD